MLRASSGERLRNGTVSVCLPVCLSRRSTAAATCSRFAAARARAADIDASCRRRYRATDRICRWSQSSAADSVNVVSREGSMQPYIYIDSEWQWHQLSHMQLCTSLQTDNHASTLLLFFYRPDALPAAQPTASKH